MPQLRALGGPVIGIEVCEIRTFELRSIVGDDLVRNSIMTNDVFNHKADHFYRSDGRHWFGFHPFSEVIDCHYTYLALPLAIGSLPIRSIPQTANSLELTIWVNSFVGAIGIFGNIW